MRRSYYENHNPHLKFYFEAFHYLVDEFFSATRNSIALRDEDVCFPPHSTPFHKVELKEIIEGLDSATGLSDIVKAHFNIIKALLLIVVTSFNKKALQWEETKASKPKKKKGKKGAKDTSDADSREDSLSNLLNAVNLIA